MWGCWPPPSTRPPANSARAGAAPRVPGGARHRGGNRAVTSQPRTRQSTSCGDMKSLCGGGRWVGQEWVRTRGTQERQQTGGGATQPHRTREPHQEARRRVQQTRRRGAARQERQPGQREQETRTWESMRMGGSDNKGDGLASQPRRYRVPGQPLLNRHQVGVSRSPDGLFAQQEREPNRGRPAVRGTGTCGGWPGQRVEEQGTWASHTRKHSEAGYGRPVDGGVCGQQKQSNDPHNNQHTFNVPTTGRR